MKNELNTLVSAILMSLTMLAIPNNVQADKETQELLGNIEKEHNNGESIDEGTIEAFLGKQEVVFVENKESYRNWKETIRQTKDLDADLSDLIIYLWSELNWPIQMDAKEILEADSTLKCNP